MASRPAGAVPPAEPDPLGRRGAVKRGPGVANVDQQPPLGRQVSQGSSNAPQAEKTGHDFTNNNLVAAGSLLVAIPTLIVFFTLQRHFVAGLTLGANKG